MNMTGALLIGARNVFREKRFHAVAAEDGAPLPVAFSCAEARDVRAACALADDAFDSFRATAPDARAAFLDRIASGIEAQGRELIARAMAETGLPHARLAGECNRTMGQLRLFARALRLGRCFDVRIDPALPDRTPFPRPDLRMIRIGIGPVAVFGASNFPFAFSVAGGDTASALAAGCPVVARAHPAHPGVSELMGRIVRDAVAASGLPEGVFSLLGGPSHEIGAALVRDPAIMAVGFTGSRAGGLALAAMAAARPVPIPFYGELSAINPVYLLPDALEARAETLGKDFIASLTREAGQFCTNPGLILAVESPALDRFRAAALAALDDSAAQTMLTGGIHAAYESGVAALAERPGVTCLGRGAPGGPQACQAALFETSAAAFMADPALGQEIFGATSLLVTCPDSATMQALTAGLEGQLTATLHMAPTDLPLARSLMPMLERKAGRILANGWPTGVELCDAMVHGGPFPATTDPRTTSVGTAAIERFLRPVCYQDIPETLLPDGVKHSNPFGLPRGLDGAY